jgi:uncharacterized protein YcbX
VQTIGSVAALGRFPVKSMQGEQIERADVTTAGFPGDRAYAVVDDETGKVASAKHPRKWAALLDCRARFTSEPMAGEPAPPAVITLPDGSEVSTDHPSVHGALSAALGRPVHLSARAADDRTLEEVWPAIDGLAPAEFIENTAIGVESSGETVTDVSMGLAAPAGTFFDLAVLHVLASATLDHLQTLYPGGTFDRRRYRPNIVVDGALEGFVENSWVGRTLTVGDVRIDVSLPTMRCVMTTMAQGDLPRDVELLRTVARHNRVEIPGFGHWACVGAYAGVQSGGALAVGDSVALG